MSTLGANAPCRPVRSALRVLFLSAALVASALPARAQPATAVAEQKISDTSGGFDGSLDDVDLFGHSVAVLGDIDGNGSPDLAVGASEDDDGGKNRGAVYIVMLNPDGTVAAQTKISDLVGNFDGELNNRDQFGFSVAAVGDLDGDGRSELAVGAYDDDDGGGNRGAVWILFLGGDGRVRSHAKISQTVGGFNGTLNDGDQFGSSVTSVGDLNADGVPDLAVGARFDDDGGAASNSNRGAVWLLFLRNDGSVLTQAKVSAADSALAGELSDADHFGRSVAALGDLDDDGNVEIAIGAPGADDGGDDRGAVWIVSVNANGSVARVSKISHTTGAFAGELDDVDRFGFSVATIGDVDLDGVVDLVVGAPLDDDGEASSKADRGAVWLLLLTSTGDVKAHSKISQTSGGFGGDLSGRVQFGVAAALLGDLDGDGFEDIAVGARRDDDGGANRGAVWIVFFEFGKCGNGVVDELEECDDGNTRNGDCCDSQCRNVAAGTICPDDGNPCTGDVCDGAGNCMHGEPAGCLEAARTSLHIVDSSNDANDRVVWRWLQGAQTTFSDFGSPDTGTLYALCIDDGVGGVTADGVGPAYQPRARFFVPPGTDWTARHDRRWVFAEATGQIDGVVEVLLRPGRTGDSRAVVKVRGVNAALPETSTDDRYFRQSPSVRARLVSTDGLCLRSEYFASGVNNGRRFKVRQTQ